MSVPFALQAVEHAPAGGLVCLRERPRAARSFSSRGRLPRGQRRLRLLAYDHAAESEAKVRSCLLISPFAVAWLFLIQNVLKKRNLFLKMKTFFSFRFFCSIPSSLPTLKTRSGQHFLLNVVVVDLDPKSFSKVANTALSWDEEISAAYRANRARPDQCEDLSRSSSSCSSSSPSRLTSTSSSPAPPSPKSCRLSRPL